MDEKRFILALAGGVGGGKLCRGLAAALPPDQLAVVVNTADDFVHLGLHISPDIDSVLYALAGRNDPERGWGLAGETWNFMEAMALLGGETWFRLGDRDLATHILRTAELKSGRTLSEVTAHLRQRLGIAHAVAPMSDQPVRSKVETDEGTLEFQDYFVKRRCKPIFRRVTFEGAGTAEPSHLFATGLERAQAIIITPSNPFVSVDPALSLVGVKKALRRRGRPVVAVSPIVGGRAIKGPLAKMMAETGLETSPLGVARYYGDLVDGWIIDDADRALGRKITALGRHVKICNTLMQSLDDSRRLAHDAVNFACELAAGPAS
jgi:LPPG:FO 2-phospho-L-lactate transferase